MMNKQLYTGVVGQQSGGLNLYRRTLTGSIVSVADILVPKTSDSIFEYSGKSLISVVTPDKESAKSKFTVLLLCVHDWIKVLSVIILFVILMVALRTLTLSSQILAVSAIGDAFDQYTSSGNVVWGVIVGHIVATTIQSNQITTHVVLPLVATGKMSMRSSLPVLMGANIGASLTCTWLALLQIRDARCFRRSFATSMLHSKYALCSTVVILTLENLTGMLHSFVVTSIPDEVTPFLPNFLLHPFDELAHLLLQIDEGAWLARITNPRQFVGMERLQIVRHKCGNGTERCLHLFNLDINNDLVIGIIVFILSLVVLSASCHFIMALLRSLAKNQFLLRIQYYVSDLNVKTTSCTTYTGLLLTTVATVIVGNSTTIMVLLMLLVGWQCLTLQFAYPLTVGANIGSASLLLIDFLTISQHYTDRRHAVQLAVAYFLYTIISLIFLAIPFMQWPLYFAYRTGNLVANYRWTAVPFILFFYYLSPILFHILAVYSLLSFGILSFLISLVTILGLVVYYLQHVSPSLLPAALRNWKFLPSWMRSLERIDTIVKYPFQRNWKPSKVEPCLESLSDAVPFIDSQAGDSISAVIDRINRKYTKKTSMMLQYAMETNPTNIQLNVPTKPTVFYAPVPSRFSTASPHASAHVSLAVTPVSPINSNHVADTKGLHHRGLLQVGSSYSTLSVGGAEKKLATQLNASGKVHSRQASTSIKDFHINSPPLQQVDYNESPSLHSSKINSDSVLVEKKIHPSSIEKPK